MQAHMTFGGASLRRTMSRTRLLLKRQLWVWPILAIVTLAAVGLTVRGLIHQTMEESLHSELSTLLSVERSMLEKWFKVQESAALTLASNREVRTAVTAILAADADARSKVDTQDTSAGEPNPQKPQARLAKALEAAMSAHDFVGFVAADKNLKIVAADAAELVGRSAAEYEGFLKQALSGKTTVSPPFPSISIQKDSAGRLRTGTPTMFVVAPVRDEDLQVVAVLALRIFPENEFTEILQLGRIGTTGETYAVNKDGVMVSNSRFDERLILAGLLPDDDLAASILNIQVRDPGGDTTAGFRPGVRRRELPLTEICAATINGADGASLEGYRNYRGAPAVGACSWLPGYDIGIITEIDMAEAYRPLTILKRMFYALFALLGLCAAAIFMFSVIVARANRQAQLAAVEAKQLGQYRLLEKIGAGAMGVVYKGQHAMLRRPTAIKMLDVDRVSEAAVQRFEREVQITCNLNNPHTVAIYDYGRTPEGVFYYAMEYLDGINLQLLVDEFGPQPEGRVVNILRQICASLYEAHSSGLVHRDIKPANIMLNRRGAEPDVVKVLDFGLVKATGKNDRETANEMSGTPLYMSPEAIQTPDSVDACSDLYAVGAVGYFLLTGQTVFDARTLGELCQQHLTAIPDSPSQRLGRAISPELEHAILACLEKNRAKRPQTARDLSAVLGRANVTWSLDDAEAWWSRYDRARHVASETRGESTATSEFRATVAAQNLTKSDVKPSVSTPATVTPGFDRTTVFEPTDDSAD